MTWFWSRFPAQQHHIGIRRHNCIVHHACHSIPICKASGRCEHANGTCSRTAAVQDAAASASCDPPDLDSFAQALRSRIKLAQPETGDPPRMLSGGRAAPMYLPIRSKSPDRYRGRHPLRYVHTWRWIRDAARPLSGYDRGWPIRADAW